jgi:peptidoglycan/xylan/chitin deacetylase (PgdA/CDA1 family)
MKRVFSRGMMWGLCVALLVCVAAAFGAGGEESADGALPATIYGNEAVLGDSILITIDDCADEALTAQMFDFLIARGVRATVFPNTVYMLRQNPLLWQNAIANGFEIGYHTRTHVSGMSQSQLAADFALFQDEVRQVLADPTHTITLVRPPYGIWDDNWEAWAAANDLHTVRWNVVPRARLTLEYAAGVIANRARGGSILLFHPRPTDWAWLQRHYDGLAALTTADGAPYRFVTVSEAFGVAPSPTPATLATATATRRPAPTRAP